MPNGVVGEWLKSLRYTVEYYDEVRGMKIPDVWETREEERDAVLDIKYGRLCRVSFVFDETIERLGVEPVVYENLDPEDLSDDVVMWKKELRYSVCGEEEYFFENEDLISEFAEEPKDAAENSSKPQSFPITEEDQEVQFRIAKNVKTPERPKTYTSSITSKRKEDSFDYKGPFRLEIYGYSCVKIKNKETLKVKNGHLHVVGENGQHKTTIKRNVQFKKGTKLIGKTEVEMIEADKTIYRFFFDSEKDAKLFIETEKSRSSGVKNVGPFSMSQFLKLWKKRSSKDLLEEKGILKNEPIFGNTLQELCNRENPVPEVVVRIIQLIEEPGNITSEGLYRASANLAVVQNIRFEINCGRWSILEKHKSDVDVLAGTLKLFFRELKEPLLSYEVFERLQIADTEDQISTVINNLPAANRDTFLYLVKHLLRVCQHKAHNKMDFHNISICWGPSLLTYPANCLDLVEQTAKFTQMTETLLDHYSRVSGDVTRFIPKTTDQVHEVIRKLTESIEPHLDTEGIYRKSGSTMRIDSIVRQLDEKLALASFDPSQYDVHDLCCALKKFLSSLQEPLINDEVFGRFCEVCDTLKERLLVEEAQKLVDTLPRKNSLLLLLKHLRRVIDREKKNKMSLVTMTDLWMTTLTTPNVQQYKKKNQKSALFFQILMSMNSVVLPDLLPRVSKYDNVPEDINSDSSAK